MSLPSMWGHGGGSAGEIKLYSRGECGKSGWVPIGGVAPFSWRFLAVLVLASASSEIPSLPVWEKNVIGWKVASISPYETLCIISSLLIFTARSVVLTDLKGEFLVDLTYSESPLLPPKLSAGVTTLSGLSGGLGDVI